MHPYPPVNRLLPVIRNQNQAEHTNHRLLPSEESVRLPFKSRRTSMRNPKAFRDTNKPILKAISHESESDSSFEENRYRWVNDIREEAPSLFLSTKSKSRAIPIPDRYVANEDEVSEQAKHRYNLATWNMYERIVNYRQRNPIGGAYTQEDMALLTPEKKDLPDAKSEPHSYYPGIDYYDMKEEIFDMEI
mmetsp:Transcript_11952/g.22851  ORF Transcript_11952/g.22851 Transcript_11952/m.22851 type:complete len:190 (-) Transcript_11952:25-594(-)